MAGLSVTMTDVGQAIFFNFCFFIVTGNSKIEQWEWIWSMINLEMMEERRKKKEGYNGLQLMVYYISKFDTV